MEGRTITPEDEAKYPHLQRFTFAAPPGLEDEVLDASVLRGREDGKWVIKMVWILSADERQALIDNTGDVWLTIWGNGMPPVSLGVH